MADTNPDPTVNPIVPEVMVEITTTITARWGRVWLSVQHEHAGAGRQLADEVDVALLGAVALVHQVIGHLPESSVDGEQDE